jgi:hypothetical protein
MAPATPSSAIGALFFFKEPLAAPCCVKWVSACCKKKKVSAEPAFLKKKINKQDGFYFGWKRTSVVLFYMGRSSLFVDKGEFPVCCNIIPYLRVLLKSEFDLVNINTLAHPAGAWLISHTFFSQRTIFFSHNESANNTFNHDFSAQR